VSTNGPRRQRTLGVRPVHGSRSTSCKGSGSTDSEGDARASDDGRGPITFFRILLAIFVWTLAILVVRPRSPGCELPLPVHDHGRRPTSIPVRVRIAFTVLARYTFLYRCTQTWFVFHSSEVACAKIIPYSIKSSVQHGRLQNVPNGRPPGRRHQIVQYSGNEQRAFSRSHFRCQHIHIPNSFSDRDAHAV
jgi:hypothetical protein